MFKKIFFTLILCFSLNISYSANPEDLAHNAAVLAYGWSDNDQCVKMLMAHEARFNAWTLPGGKKESNQTIHQAAAQELFEETAAYPAFAPEKTLSNINSLDNRHKFYTGHNNNTVTYCLYVSGGIDGYENIGNNWAARVNNLPGAYREMDDWKWVRMSDVESHFKAHTSTRITPEGKLGGPPHVQAQIGNEALNIRNVSYRALQKFSHPKRHDSFNMLINDATPKRQVTNSSEPKKPIKKINPFTQPSVDSSTPMAGGVIWLEKELAQKNPSTQKMFDLIRGDTGKILSRGATPHELQIIANALAHIAPSLTIDQMMDSYIITGPSEKAKKHQRIVWACVNILKDSRETGLLNALTQAQQKKVKKILSLIP